MEVYNEKLLDFEKDGLLDINNERIKPTYKGFKLLDYMLTRLFF